MEVRVNDVALKEHDIEGRKVIQAVPRAEFQITVESSGFGGLFLIECHIDGKQVSGRHFVDPAAQTSRGGARATTFAHWVKSRDDQEVKHAIAFAGNASADDDDEGGGRPAVASWTHGKIEVKIFEGEMRTLARDSHSASHDADLSRASVGNEKQMVKNGLSVSASAGATSFGNLGVWRAGETYVARKEDEKAPIMALELFYRDSFFMALREDTCCHGACAPDRAGAASGAASTLQAESDALAAAGAVGGATRAKVVHERETHEALARKRPDRRGNREALPIDLCESDDE